MVASFATQLLQQWQQPFMASLRALARLMMQPSVKGLRGMVDDDTKKKSRPFLSQFFTPIFLGKDTDFRKLSLWGVKSQKRALHAIVHLQMTRIGEIETYQFRSRRMIEARLEDLKNKFGSKPTVVVTEKDYDRDSKILGGLDPFDVLVLCCKMQILSHNSCSEDRSGELRNSSLFGMGPNDTRSGESGYCFYWCCCFGMGQNVSGTLGVHPCDRRSVSEYECLFLIVDFSLASIESEEGVLWKADVRETKEELTSRGKKFLDWLLTWEEKEIAIVTHSGFLFHTLDTFGNVCHLLVRKEVNKHFINCELRSKVIVDESLIFTSFIVIPPRRDIQSATVDEKLSNDKFVSGST
ncbi:hypothetical protein Tco_0469113 [Tanacetum coccineum]